VPFFFGFTSGDVITDEIQFLEPNSRYTVRSEIATKDKSILNSSPAKIGFTDNEQAANFYFGFNFEIYSLAYSITQNATTDYEKAKAVESYLQTNYTYEPGESDVKLSQFSIEDFLLNSKKGDLTHFAGAMVMLFDVLEIDSRIANGFLQGTY